MFPVLHSLPSTNNKENGLEIHSIRERWKGRVNQVPKRSVDKQLGLVWLAVMARDSNPGH